MARTELKRIIYIPFDHLHRNFGALKEADPQQVLKGLEQGKI